MLAQHLKEEWPYYLGIFLAFLLFFVFILTVGSSKESRRRTPRQEVPFYTTFTETEASPRSISEIKEIDDRYPPSAKEQRALHTLYDDGDVQYSIERVRINLTRKPEHGKHELRVNYNNSSQSPMPLPESAQLSCIGKKTHDGIYSVEEPKPQPMELRTGKAGPVALRVDPECIYLGTLDKKYFWVIR